MSARPSVQIVAMNYSGVAKDSAVVTDLADSIGWRARPTWLTPFSFPRRAMRRLGLHKLLRGRFDLNIFMSQPEKWWLPQARRSVVIPNADWFTDVGVQLIPEIHQMWCKTREAVDIFRGLGAESTYLGFTSMDPRQLVTVVPEKNWREALHLSGGSALKGTAQVIDAWRRNPHWPKLHLVTPFPSMISRASSVPNIHVWGSRLTAMDCALLQLRCGVHVQPSETEGYGHVLGEALASGSVVVSADAPPMNELVQDSRGYLVKSRPTTMHYLARRYEVLPDHLDETLNTLWDTPVERLEEKGRAARNWYLQNRTMFHHRLKELLTALL